MNDKQTVYHVRGCRKEGDNYVSLAIHIPAHNEDLAKEVFLATVQSENEPPFDTITVKKVSKNTGKI